MKMPAIKAYSLNKSYSGYKAVSDLSLTVPEGSIYGFLGPNGAGKTTTIKMLTGMLKPDSGSIELFGEKLVFGKPYPSDWIGLLPDVPDFYGWMNGEEFLRLCANLIGMKKEGLEERIKDILIKVGLNKYSKRIKGYSRGMKQRLGIAQALLHKPRIVFLDEPTSALDPVGRKEVLDLIGSLRNEVTVFLSTHILTDVERICDRVAVLDKGKIILEDEITSLKDTFSDGRVQIKVFPHMRDAALEILKKCPFISEVNCREENIIEFKMQVNERNSTELICTLASQNIGITELITNKADLEDIFVRVVNHK